MPSAERVTRAGTHHTQWRDQETGEISSAANAFSDRARQSSDAASARRIPRQATAATMADSASQAAMTTRVCGSSPARASTARMDWFLADGAFCDPITKSAQEPVT
jgi:hypothetical protein